MYFGEQAHHIEAHHLAFFVKFILSHSFQKLAELFTKASLCPASGVRTLAISFRYIWDPIAETIGLRSVLVWCQQSELAHLNKVFQSNGYSKLVINKVMHPTKYHPLHRSYRISRGRFSSHHTYERLARWLRNTQSTRYQSIMPAGLEVI